MPRQILIEKVGQTTVVRSWNNISQSDIISYYYNKGADYVVKDDVLIIEDYSKVHPKLLIKFEEINNNLGATNIKEYSDLIAQNLFFLSNTSSSGSSDFATQPEVNNGAINDKSIAPNTLAGWWTYQKTLIQTFSNKISFKLGALFSPQAQPSHERGRIYFDDVNDCISYMDSVSGTSVQVGYEVLMRARNNTGATITNGSIVYISGALGQNSTISLAKSNSINTSEIIGVATHDILDNTVGKVCVFGLVNDIDTSSFSNGQIVYLSSTVDGGLVSSIPASPNYVIAIGVIEYSHVTKGKLLVRSSRALSNNNSLGSNQNIAATENAVKTYIDTEIKDKLIKNLAVTGSLNIDWSKSTYRLNLTGNITFTESNLPTSSYSKVITLHITGNFGIVFPASWEINATGEYDGTAFNTIVIEYFDGEYKMQIIQND